MAMRVTFVPSGMAHIAVVVDDMIHKVGEEITADMRQLVPVDTGALRASIKVAHVKRKSKITIGTNHWAHVEYGTRPHEIKAKGNYPLRNRRTGRVFGRRVWHPGTPAQPYIRPAVYRMRSV